MCIFWSVIAEKYSVSVLAAGIKTLGFGREDRGQDPPWRATGTPQLLLGLQLGSPGRSESTWGRGSA